MNLSEAIDYLSGDDKYFIRQLGDKKADALKLVLEVLKDNVDIDEWDWEYEHDVPMCIHCSGNGCASCKNTGDAKIY